MRRRDLLKTGIGTIVMGAALVRADDPLAESDPAATVQKLMKLIDKVPIEVVKLSETLQIVSGAGGNIAVLSGPDGVTAIDSGFPQRGKQALETSQKISGKPVTTLINTHWHTDHAGGNAVFHSGGARIIATATTRKRLSTDQFTEMFKLTTPATAPEGLPSLTVDEAELHVGDETLHLIPFAPAHTDGDLAIHFVKADVIHTGDLFNNGFYPNIDASSGGWIGGMIAAADRLLKMAGPKTKIIPGHGPVATSEDLAAFRKMLVGIQDRVAPMVDAGKTVEEVILARPTQPFDAAFGQGFFNGPTFARVVYGGIVNHRKEAKK